jgi:hypothetical protein
MRVRDDVRELDERSVGEFPAISPWRKLGASARYRTFAVTRKTPGGDIVLRYYAGAGGLAVVSIETIGPLDPSAASQSERVLRCLELAFV